MVDPLKRSDLPCDESVWLEGVNREFREQTEQYNFRYLCHDCCYLGEGDACIQGFPNEMLLSVRTPVVLRRGQWTFCKYFELD